MKSTFSNKELSILLAQGYVTHEQGSMKLFSPCMEFYVVFSKSHGRFQLSLYEMLKTGDKEVITKTPSKLTDALIIARKLLITQ